MKKFYVGFITFVLLFSGLIILSNSVSALTWTESCVDPGVLPLCDSAGAAFVMGQVALKEGFQSAYYNVGTSLIRATSNNFGLSWSLSTVVSNFQVAGDFKRANFDSAYACWKGGSEDLYFQFTHDSGFTFSTPSVIETTNDVGNMCTIWAGSDSFVGIAYMDETLDEWYFKKSVNGGSSFGTPILIKTGCTSGVTNTNAQFGFKNTTTGFIVFKCIASENSVCLTTDGGDTWVSCYQLIFTNPFTQIIYEPVTNAYYGLQATTPSTVITIAKFTNDGANYATFTTDAWNGADVVDVGSLIIHDSEHYSIISCRDTSTTVFYKTTTDRGLTWSISEIVLIGRSNGVGTIVSCGATGTQTRIVEAYAQEDESGFIHVFTPIGNGATQNHLQWANAQYFTPFQGEMSIYTLIGATLVGADVDKFTTGIIIRENTGIVRTLQGLDLSSIATFDTDCNRVDGVLASVNTVAYIDCDGTADPTDLHVRNYNLQDITVQNCPQCDFDISLSGFSASGGDGALELGEIVDFPIDHSARRAGPFIAFGTESALLAWGFSASTGKFGINTFVNHNNAQDERITEERDFSLTGAPNQLCTQKDGTQTYITAVREGIAANQYRADFNYQASAEPGAQLEVDLLGPSTYPSSLGIACSQNRVIIQHANTTLVSVLDRASGASICSFVRTGTDDRAVALSDLVEENNNNRFGAFVDGTTIKIIKITSTNTCSIQEPPLSLPTGNFYSMKMSSKGQELYVFTSTQVVRFHITALTTVEEISELPEAEEPPAPTTDPSAVLGGAGASLAEALGITVAGGNAILGLLIMFAIGALLFVFALGAGIIVATFAGLGGMGLGFLIAAQIGLFNTVIVFGALFILGALVIYFKTR